MAYPELVSRVGFQKSQIKGLVNVSASNFSKGVIRVYLPKKSWRGGVSGQPETPSGYATGRGNWPKAGP